MGQGNIFVTGTSASSWLGDGNADPRHPHSDSDDIAVLKLSDDGGYAWHTFYGSSADDNGAGIAIDGQDNLVILGECYGSWLGDQGASPLHAYQDGYDMAVLKLSDNGAYQWHTFYGSNAYDDIPTNVAFDTFNNIIISGSSDASWNGDGEIAPLHAHSGCTDMTVLKLSIAGAYQWHTFYGSGESDYGDSISVDAQEQLLVAGTSFAGWLGDGNSPPIHQYHESADITVFKLDDDGHYIWHTFYGSNSHEGGTLALDSIGNAVIAGFGDSSWQGDGGTAPLKSL